MTKEFYRAYHLEFWRYKLFLLQYAFDNYEVFKDDLHEVLPRADDEDFSKMLKAEIHFTYFQIVESLFEMIFALENGQDANLWRKLSFSNWHKNYGRIEQIAEGKVDFLDKAIKLNEEVTITLVRYIFYFTYTTGLTKSEMQDNLKFIKKALVLFAKDFSDRGDYNAYKHSLRTYQSPFRVGIAPTGEEHKGFHIFSQAKDAFIYLEKGKDNRVMKTAKAFDPERDFRMGLLCVDLLSTIIVARRKFFYEIDGPFLVFNTLDLGEISKRSTTGKVSFTI